MSQERLDEVIKEMQFWQDRKVRSKRKLLSLLGKLVFLCRVVQPGRIFLRRLFAAASRVCSLHHRVCLSSDSCADIRWWLSFVQVWNHKSVFYEDQWISSVDCSLSTDASDLGFGAVFGSRWLFGSFESMFLKCERPSIAWRELWAVLVACRCWGHLLSGKRVQIQCDNISVVYCVNSGSSKCPHLMQLVRDLFFACAFFCVDIRLVHIPGVNNVGADLLSRLRVEEFRRVFPMTSPYPTSVPALYRY
jgi:hypothetical protein